MASYLAKYASVIAAALLAGYLAGSVYRAYAVDVEMKPAACYVVVAHSEGDNDADIQYALVFNGCNPGFAWLAVPPVPGGV